MSYNQYTTPNSSVSSTVTPSIEPVQRIEPTTFNLSYPIYAMAISLKAAGYLYSINMVTGSVIYVLNNLPNVDVSKMVCNIQGEKNKIAIVGCVLIAGLGLEKIATRFSKS